MTNSYRFKASLRQALMLVSGLALIGCASSGNETAPPQSSVVEAQRSADQAAARVAQERARLAADAARDREAFVAREEAARRVQVEEAAQATREEIARARAADQQRLREEEAAQLVRIERLEAELAAARLTGSTQATASTRLEEAIATAEELLQLLSAEQLKYGNTDAAGQPVEPLQKDLIAELEARKNSLKQEAQALSQQ